MKWVNDYNKVVWTTTLSPPSLQVATVSLGAISSFNQELLDGLNGLLHTFPPGYSRSYTSMINAYLEMSWVYTHLITSQVFPFQECRLLVSKRNCSMYEAPDGEQRGLTVRWKKEDIPANSMNFLGLDFSIWKSRIDTITRLLQGFS